jgi:hypothetical protein
MRHLLLRKILHVLHHDLFHPLQIRASITSATFFVTTLSLALDLLQGLSSDHAISNVARSKLIL